MQPLRVLIVDDELGMRLGVQRVLADCPVRLMDIDAEIRFQTFQAATGEEALQMISAKSPDILLLDHKLPGISGLEILEKIAAYQDMVTVMITAYASLETAITATKRGAYDFLAKPFTPDELKATVSKAARHLLLQRQARRLAEEKRQVRFQFISVLAHELKAPIGAIQGYLKIIQNRSLGDDQQTYDHMLARSLIRLEGMHKLIMDLLDLTRIESGQKTRELIDVDPPEVARECLETFAPAARQNNLTLEFHGDRQARMLADRQELQIIFNNLISNAVKYNRPSGRVDVTVTTQDDLVKIIVADTGVGIANDKLGKLFEEFTRIKNEKTRHIIGSGLGLSIVKKLAALYDGQVSVSSQPDVGTTFTVTLRLKPRSDKNEPGTDT